MKRFAALFLSLLFLFLTACGSDNLDVVSSTSAVESTAFAETATQPDELSANDSYGNVTKTDGVPVMDHSVIFRTKDSCRLESVAVRAALEMIRNETAQPDSLQISNSNVWNCADDGTCVYYSFYFNTTSLAGDGERLKHAYFYDVGVRKSDETAFDAANDMERVTEAYSVFDLQAARDAVVTPDFLQISEVDLLESAAKQIAMLRLKNQSDGTILSAEQRLNDSNESCSVWDVLGEGENDFGMRIRDVYTVYIRFENEQIREVDPAE